MNSLALAPMAEINNIIFRGICRGFGASPLITGMISADALSLKHKPSFNLAYFEEAERPIGIQLFASDPQILASAASALVALHPPDFIDLNAGCPVRKVVKRNAGAALLKDLPFLKSMVSSLVRAVHPIPVSVKIRSGWNHSRIEELVDVVNEAGASYIILHPRLATEDYSIQADKSMIKLAQDRSSVGVIASGDIKNWSDALNLHQESNCKGVMIGREARTNPFMFRKNYIEPTDGDRIALALFYLRSCFNMYGERSFFSSKPFCAGFTKGISNGADIRRRIFASTSYGEIKTLLTTALDKEDTFNYPQFLKPI